MKKPKKMPSNNLIDSFFSLRTSIMVSIDLPMPHSMMNDLKTPSSQRPLKSKISE